MTSRMREADEKMMMTVFRIELELQPRCYLASELEFSRKNVPTSIFFCNSGTSRVAFMLFVATASIMKNIVKIRVTRGRFPALDSIN